MNLERLSSVRSGIGHITGSVGSRTNILLNAAFVNATSGAAVAIRYMAMTADPIDELYIFMDAFAGTLGNITMAAEIFNERAAQPSRPGATSRDTSTATTMPAGADQWIKFAFGTPYTPAVGEILWLVASNTAAAPATDYPQIMSLTTGLIGDPSGIGPMMGYSTADGFATNGTGAAEMPFVVKQGSNYFSQPFTQRNNAPYTSNTLERGMQITLDEDVVIVGAIFDSAVAFASLRILADATAPGGTALNSYDLSGVANQTTQDYCGGLIFPTPVTLSGGTTYKVTFTFSAVGTAPAAFQIEDYASYSTMFDTLRGYDTMILPWSVLDDGAGGWTTNKSLAPMIKLIVGSFPAIVGGGGRPELRGSNL